LPIPDACALTRQAAVGLQHAAEQGLIHRDLKPANLMLTPGGQVKILDLGLALLYDVAPPGKDSAVFGLVAGTADYMAPEVTLGSPSLDARADLYSLGCTFYELLTGRPPFGGPAYATVFQKLRAHAEAEAVAIGKLRPEVSEELAQVLKRLLAKNPADRFGSAAQVAAALEPFTATADLGRLMASEKVGPAVSPLDRRLVQPTEDYLPGQEP